LQLHTSHDRHIGLNSQSAHWFRSGTGPRRRFNCSCIPARGEFAVRGKAARNHGKNHDFCAVMRSRSVSAEEQLTSAAKSIPYRPSGPHRSSQGCRHDRIQLCPSCPDLDHSGSPLSLLRGSTGTKLTLDSTRPLRPWLFRGDPPHPTGQDSPPGVTTTNRAAAATSSRPRTGRHALATGTRTSRTLHGFAAHSRNGGGKRFPPHWRETSHRDRGGRQRIARPDYPPGRSMDRAVRRLFPFAPAEPLLFGWNQQRYTPNLHSKNGGTDPPPTGAPGPHAD
jgi:hypothetical protein